MTFSEPEKLRVEKHIVLEIVMAVETDLWQICSSFVRGQCDILLLHLARLGVMPNSKE